MKHTPVSACCTSGGFAHPTAAHARFVASAIAWPDAGFLAPGIFCTTFCTGMACAAAGTFVSGAGFVAVSSSCVGPTPCGTAGVGCGCGVIEPVAPGDEISIGTPGTVPTIAGEPIGPALAAGFSDESLFFAAAICALS